MVDDDDLLLYDDLDLERMDLDNEKFGDERLDDINLNDNDLDLLKDLQNSIFKEPKLAKPQALSTANEPFIEPVEENKQVEVNVIEPMKKVNEPLIVVDTEFSGVNIETQLIDNQGFESDDEVL